MSLIDKIRAIFQGADRRQAGITTAQPVPDRGDGVGLAARYAAETERIRVIEACRQMYRTDPRAKRMIRQLARDIVKGGFAIKVDNDQAAEIAQNLYERLDLEQSLDDWVRLTARDGDSFLEVVINDRLEIVEISRKPTLLVRRNSDAFDRFPDPNRAYWMAERHYLGAEPPAGAVWFAEWQMIHARWEHDEGSRYGTPLMASGISAYRRVAEGELDVAVRRKTRAGLRFLHTVEGASEAELEAYKERNKSALSSTAALADFFSNKSGSIAVLQGDGHLSEIEDVRHHIATWFQAGEVPMELLGYGEDLNRDVLGEKRAEYTETLEQLRAWVVAALIKPILERQWLLAGIWPDGLSWDVHWKAKTVLTPADVLSVAEAALRLRLLGVSEDIIWGVLAQFLPGVDSEMMVQAVQTEGDSPDRIAAALAQLSGGGHV